MQKSRILSVGVVFLFLILFVSVPAMSQEGFDTPLAEVYRSTGGMVGTSFGELQSVGTQDGDDEILIDVPGTPVEAWVYWLGELRRDAEGNPAAPDPVITLENLETGSMTDLIGMEAGRRFQLFEDESQGGEHVQTADLPLWMVAEGENTFVISNFNERLGDPDDPNLRHYFRQFGVTIVVIYELPGADAEREVIALEGADVANFGRYANNAGFESQANTDVYCFDFAPLECDSTATIEFAVGGLTRKTTDDGSDKDGSGEQTLSLVGAGIPPLDLTVLDNASVLESNQLTDPELFFRGFAMGVYEGQLELSEGDSFACLQQELFAAQMDEIPQNMVVHSAIIGLDRTCPFVNQIVTIDVRPNKRRNIINSRGRKRVPVTILSGEDFSPVEDVDRSTLTFGRTGDENSLARCQRKSKDFNGDGVDDLTCLFVARKTRLKCGDRRAILNGLTNDGMPFSGSDRVKVIR